MRAVRFLTVILTLFVLSLCVSAADHNPQLSSLSIAAQSRISAVVARDVQAYRATASPAGVLHLQSREQKLGADFSSSTVTVQNDGASWSMTLKAYGHGTDLQNVQAAIPTAANNRVEYRRGNLTEWYVNGPAGLEQGFTIDHPLSAKGILVMHLGLTGNVTRRGKQLVFHDATGRAHLRYAGLFARDASGKALSANMDLQGNDLFLKINDHGARYPIVVDPTLQQIAKLTASDGQTEAAAGWSVAISGNTIVVGSPYATLDQQSQGLAYVFVKPASGWADMTENAELKASDAAIEDNFGKSVAISGNTIVVGAPEHSVGQATDQGRVYVFVEPQGGWTNAVENAQLNASDLQQHKAFGFSVGVSGTTIVVGAPSGNVGTNKLQGETYVFVQPQGGWKTMTQTALLTTSDGAAGDGLGSSVSISASTIVTGASTAKVGSNAQQGAAYVFVKPAGGWANTSTFNGKLTSSDGAAGDAFGASSSISGGTIVVGAPAAKVGSNTTQGAAYVFVQPAGGWKTMTQTAKLTSSDGAAGDTFGNSVSVSGTIVMVGAPGADLGNNASQGAGYVFVKPGSGWKNTSTPFAKLIASDGRSLDILGNSVSVSGATGVAGAPFATIGGNVAQGAAYVYSR
jgi:hypothetical protein